MRLFSSNTLPVNSSAHYLNKITTLGEEDPLFSKTAEKVWQGVLSYYKTGVSPLVGVCVYQNNRVILNRNIGHLTHLQNKIADINTPICIFSVSKMITAILVHKLCELGKLSLDDRVSYYLPKYGKASQNSFYYSTIAHLLTHTAGMPSAQLNQEKIDPNLIFNKEAVFERLYATSQRNSNPKDSSINSVAYHALTSGYILGEIIERVGQASLDELLQRYIVEPMELTLMHYGLPEHLHNQAAKHFATGFSPRLGADKYISHILDGGLQMAVDMTNDKRFYSAFCPSANIYTTTKDIASVMQMLKNNGQFYGKTILQKSTVDVLKHAPNGFGFDKTLLIPMRYGHGVMHGANPIGLFGVNSASCFGHLGFTNILCWADTKRNISVSFLNTGKAVLGTHVPSIANIFWQNFRHL